MLHHASLSFELPIPVPEHDGLPQALSAADAALLRLADPRTDSRVSLIGPNTLELLCALLRQGCTDLLATRVCDWPQANSADVAVVAHVVSPDCLARAVAHARRILAPLGTVVVQVAAGPADALVRQADQLLLLHGFDAARLREVAGQTLLRAELPLHGRLACA